MPALPMIFACALTSMYPASSQIHGPPAPEPRALPGFKPGVGHDIREVRSEIDDGRDSGQLSRKQARHLKREAGEIRALEERYARDGLDEQEQSELRNRVEVLRAITRAKRIGRIK